MGNLGHPWDKKATEQRVKRSEQSEEYHRGYNAGYQRGQRRGFRQGTRAGYAAATDVETWGRELICTRLPHLFDAGDSEPFEQMLEELVIQVENNR